MGWSLNKCQIIFYTLFSLSVACAGAALLLLQHTNKTQDRELIYIFFLVEGTGLCCLWFRVFRDNVVWSHTIVSTFVLALLIVGRYNLIKEVKDHGLKTPYQNYGLDLFIIGLYAAQYAMSLHLFLFRYGHTVSERILRITCHSFPGAIIHFTCVIGACCRIHIFPAPKNKNSSNDNALMRVLFLFVAGVLLWYLLLEPNLDWRRLNALLVKKKKKAEAEARKAAASKKGSKFSTNKPAKKRSFK